MQAVRSASTSVCVWRASRRARCRRADDDGLSRAPPDLQRRRHEDVPGRHRIRRGNRRFRAIAVSAAAACGARYRRCGGHDQRRHTHLPSSTRDARYHARTGRSGTISSSTRRTNSANSRAVWPRRFRGTARDCLWVCRETANRRLCTFAGRRIDRLAPAGCLLRRATTSAIPSRIRRRRRIGHEEDQPVGPVSRPEF